MPTIERTPFEALMALRAGRPERVIYRRRWYADDEAAQEPDADGGADDSQNEPNTPPAKDSDEGNIDALPGWAQSYIKELRGEAAERRVALQKEQERQSRIEQERLAEQGKWKELAEKRAQELQKLTTYQERAETLEGMIRQSNERRIEQIPEGMRGLVPTDYAPEQLSSWLDTNISTLTKPTAPSLDGGAGSGGSGSRLPTLTDEERQIARRTGISEEKYAERKAQIEARRAGREG